MKHGWLILLIGLISCAGLGACTQNEITGEDTISPTPVAVEPSPTQPEEIPTTSPPLIPPTSTSEPIPTPIISPSPYHPPPSLTPTQLICWAQGGRVEGKQIETTWLPEPLEFRIYTPPCYDQIPENRYPVLYLLHGQSFNVDQWERLGVTEIVDRLTAAGEIPPFIIVMPRDRQNQTAPPKNKFGEALLNDLIPYIDAQYRTLTDREYRAIGGLSRGGNWAVRIGLSSWELFGAIGAHSTPTFVKDGPPQIREWLDDIPDDHLPRLFLDTAENDPWVDLILEFETVLNTEGVPHEWYLFPGYHEEAYWASHVEQYLRWYAEMW